MQTPGYPGYTHTSMDPLATNYFTNGQMGYMPQSQYLTSPEYGAFRTPQSHTQYPTGYNYPSFTQSLMTTWRGADKSGFQRAVGEFAAPSPMGTNQIGYQAEAARKVRDSIDAATSSVIDAGIKLVSTGAGFAMGGVGGAMAGYELAPKVGSIFTERTRTARQLQQMTSPLIVSGKDVNTATGQGFSLPAAGDFTKFLHKESASDYFFKADDYKKFAAMSAQSGMFDYANSVDQYKDTITKIRKDMLVLMDVFETADPADVFKQLQRLQTSGAGQSQFMGVASKERMYSTMLGMGHQEMVNTYGQQGALIYNQMGRTGYLGELANVSNAANLTMAKRLGLLSRDEENRGGGISGMAETTTREVHGRAFEDLAKIVAPYAWDGSEDGKMSKDKMATLKSGAFEVDDLLNGMRGFDQSKVLKYKTVEDKVKHELMSGLGEDGISKMVYDMAVKLADKTTMRNEPEKDKAIYGMQVMKVSAPIARQVVNSVTNPEAIKARTDHEQLQYEKNLASKVKKEEEAAHWTSKMTVKFKEAFNMFEELLQFGRSDKIKLMEKQREENKVVGRDGTRPLETQGSGFTQHRTKEDTLPNVPDEFVSLDGGSKPAPKHNAVIEAAAKEFKVPAHVLKGLFYQESRFDELAVSPAGAIGLGQIMPKTFAEEAAKLGIVNPEPRNPEHSARVGASYFRKMYNRHPSLGWEGAANDYNAGPGRMDEVRAGRRPMPAETKAHQKGTFKHAKRFYTPLPSTVEQELMEEGKFETPDELYGSDFVMKRAEYTDWWRPRTKDQNATDQQAKAWTEQGKYTAIQKSISATHEELSMGGNALYNVLEGTGLQTGEVLNILAKNTKEVKGLSGAGLEDGVYKAMLVHHGALFSKAPTSEEEATYKKKSKEIAQNEESSTFLQNRVLSGNSELRGKFDKEYGKNLQVLYEGRTNEIYAEEAKIEKSISEVSPHYGGSGPAIKGLSALMDSDVTLANVYKIATLGKAARSTGIPAAKEAFAAAQKEHPDIPVPLDAQGNLDELKYKQALIDKKYKDTDVSKVLELAESKKSELSTDKEITEFKTTVTGIPGRKEKQYHTPALLGFQRLATEHGITKEMLDDPEQMGKYAESKKDDPYVQHIYGRMKNGPFDIRGYVYEKRNALTDYANKTTTVVPSDPESQKSKKENDDRLLAPILKELTTAITEMNKAQQAIWGDVVDRNRKRVGDTKANVKEKISGL